MYPKLLVPAQKCTEMDKLGGICSLLRCTFIHNVYLGRCPQSQRAIPSVVVSIGYPTESYDLSKSASVEEMGWSANPLIAVYGQALTASHLKFSLQIRRPSQIVRRTGPCPLPPLASIGHIARSYPHPQ
jgi:hypothetical protein